MENKTQLFLSHSLSLAFTLFLLLRTLSTASLGSSNSHPYRAERGEKMVRARANPNVCLCVCFHKGRWEQHFPRHGGCFCAHTTPKPQRRANDGPTGAPLAGDSESKTSIAERRKRLRTWPCGPNFSGALFYHRTGHIWCFDGANRAGRACVRHALFETFS